MAEILSMFVTLVAGAVLGTIFFGGLRWTVVRGLSSKHAAFWFFGSYILRLSIVLGGFFLVSQLHFERLSICLLGFVIAQLMVVYLTRAAKTRSASSPTEASHAPFS